MKHAVLTSHPWVIMGLLRDKKCPMSTAALTICLCPITNGLGRTLHKLGGNENKNWASSERDSMKKKSICWGRTTERDICWDVLKNLLEVSSAGQAGVHGHRRFKIFLITGTVPPVNKENLVCHWPCAAWGSQTDLSKLRPADHKLVLAAYSPVQEQEAVRRETGEREQLYGQALKGRHECPGRKQKSS